MAKNKPSREQFCQFLIDSFEKSDKETIIVASIDYALITQNYDVCDVLVNEFMVSSSLFSIRARNEKHSGNIEKIKDFFRQIKIQTILSSKDEY